MALGTAGPPCPQAPLPQPSSAWLQASPVAGVPPSHNVAHFVPDQLEPPPHPLLLFISNSINKNITISIIRDWEIGNLD